MISDTEHFSHFTPSVYLEWEAQQEFRYEFIDGSIRRVADETLDRAIVVATNLSNMLQERFHGTVCRVFGNRTKVQTLESNSFCYPDLSVSGDVHDRSASNFITHPYLIIEVLSPRTEAYDRGEKFGLYRQSPTLQEYVLISTDRIHFDVYRQPTAGMWEFITYSSGDLVELTSVNFSFEIDRVYEDLVVESGE
ncbi:MULTISPECIES: Uma2 family endonuclease [unclassified Chamaesiphon]|uniref:Uma2 family endonuclease n=1 Tax=unclassified Chamaesiphon TaxID=2620921 RepID=UPI00286C4418|nr:MULTISPECIES: Uma2 family endonuclease [unclassified Chamaesiphon]